MFRKKRFAAEKKAALSVSYDTANQKISVTVQNGFRAVLNGVDFPQIVGKDGTVHPPLTAQTVLLSFRLTGPDGAECVTGDYPVRIPGLHSGNPAHPKPSVIPELAQWHSADNGWFIPSAHSSIVLSPDAGEALRAVAAEFQQDYREITGAELPLRYDDTPQESDFYLTLDDADAFLGREGYRASFGAAARLRTASIGPRGLCCKFCGRMEKSRACPMAKSETTPNTQCAGSCLISAAGPFLSKHCAMWQRTWPGIK